MVNSDVIIRKLSNKVDDEVVFGIFKNRLTDFDVFREFIVEYLKTHGSVGAK